MGASFVWQERVKTDRELMVTAREPERSVEERPGPDTVQLFTCEALHVMVDCSPEDTRRGSAEMVAKGCSTVMLSLSVAEPPAPVQVTLYKVGFSVRAPVETLPEAAAPVLKPVPMQEEAFEELHVSAEDWPASIVEGDAERVAVGMKALHVYGLTAPLLHESPPIESLEEPPGLPVQPPLEQETQESLTYAKLSGH